MKTKLLFFPFDITYITSIKSGNWIESRSWENLIVIHRKVNDYKKKFEHIKCTFESNF